MAGQRVVSSPSCVSIPSLGNVLQQVGHGEGAETDVLLGSEQCLTTRITLDNIPLHKTHAGKGMRLMKLKAGDSLQTVTPILATPGHSAG